MTGTDPKTMSVGQALELASALAQCAPRNLNSENAQKLLGRKGVLKSHLAELLRRIAALPEMRHLDLLPFGFEGTIENTTEEDGLVDFDRWELVEFWEAAAAAEGPFNWLMGKGATLGLNALATALKLADQGRSDWVDRKIVFHGTQIYDESVDNCRQIPVLSVNEYGGSVEWLNVEETFMEPETFHVFVPRRT